MGFLDRLLGREDRSTQQGGAVDGRPSSAPPRWGQQRPRTDDEIAVERYRSLLRTAPPDRVEEVHAEAFARLTAEQRRMVFDEMTRAAPAGEAPTADDPRSLAQAATRSEFRQPGFLERTLGANGGGYGSGPRQGPGFGSMLGASVLGTVVGTVIGSSLMSAFLPDPGFGAGADGAADSGADGGSGVDAGSDSGDTGGSGDPGVEEAGWSDGGGWDDGGGFGDLDV